METPKIYTERLNRIATAAGLGTPDRVPVVIIADGFCANHLNIKLSDFIKDPAFANKVMLDSFAQLGEIDGIGMTTCYPDVLSLPSLSMVKIPGRELPDQMGWQIDEQELIKDEDYDFIIDKGWEAFLEMYAATRLNNLFQRLDPLFNYMPKDVINTIEAGLVPFSPINLGTPYDMICGGRTLAKFIKDLYRIPDKIEAVLDIALEGVIKNLKQQMQKAKPFAVFLGGSRCSGQFLSKKLWARFSWPYVKKMVDAIVEEGAFAYLHFDGDWTRDLDYFRELPKGKCILGLDGTQSIDICKVKERIGDMMCIYGDVPAALLTLGTPDEVYDYSSKLIREIGPSGFILAAGCGVPHNAVVDNVKAMISAATGK
ncbi:MAG: uroporphyrinogen-III decarboxylase [Peptococcaceae bacterium]|nr:uroporphyrinogen-III decarboxylase [Peptococcaceae bacterium]